MPRYKLKKMCLFVDAYDLDKAQGNPTNPPDRTGQAIPYAHVMNKSEGAKKKIDGEDRYPYIKLDDRAGFIGRFIVMGVDTDLLPQIVVSEFGLSPNEAIEEINSAYNLIKEYLEEIKPREAVGPQLKKSLIAKREARPAVQEYHSGKYDLSFRVNPIMGIGIIKG